MRVSIFIIIALSLIAFSGCTDETPLAPETEQVVVQAYLYADEPVSDIRITQTFGIGSDATEGAPVNDAVVRLLRNNIAYELIASPGDSGYYHYPDTDLEIKNGDEFSLEVDYFDKIATGLTQVPAPPMELSANRDTLLISDEIHFGGFFPDTSDTNQYQITLDWQDENADDLYFVVIECIDENPTEIESIDFQRPMGGGPRAFISAPSTRTTYLINRQSISYYGRYQARVYHVNQEYADLYISRNQDSRDLNEPLTNIENGLGVFSAFSSVSIEFIAAAETE